MRGLKKIVIIGPESTGKSTLCQLLAKHYNTLWCPEYAREYLLAHGMNYTYDDLLTIAKEQIAMEDEYIEKAMQQAIIQKQENTLLFVDTNMYVMKVWCEFVFNKCHQYIIDKIAERKYDCYLLCDIDLPWVKDELREYPDLETREQLFHIYKNTLTNQNVPWTIISGSYDERLQVAIKNINETLIV